MVSYIMRRTRVPPNFTRSTKLQGVQRSLELAFRSHDFCVPENLFFPALVYHKKSNSVSLRTNPPQANQNAPIFCVFPGTEKLNTSSMQTRSPDNSNIVQMVNNST